MILYINGYKGQNSKKAIIFEKEFDAEHIIIDYDDMNSIKNGIKKIEEILKNKTPFIIASSTGAIVSQIFNVPQVLLNPLVEVEDLRALGCQNIAFLKELEMKEVFSKKMIILSRNDELLDYTKAKSKYEHKEFQNIIIKGDKHSITNIKELLGDLELYFNINNNC